MKARHLLSALGQLDEQYIQEAADITHNRKKKGWAKWGAAAAVALMIFLGAAGTAMAVSAEFRELMLSFFHIEQPELVPDNHSSRSGMRQSDIGGLVKAEYIPLEASDYEVGSGTLYQVECEEDGAIRSVRFFAVEEHTTVNLDTRKNSFQTTWQSRVYQGDIYWCVYNGELSLYGNGTANPDAPWYAAPIPGRLDAVLLYLSQGTYGEYRQYPILYHLDTGTTENILQKTGIQKLSHANSYQWTEDLSNVLVTCTAAESDNEFYLCDVPGKSLSSLSDLTGITCSSAWFADDDTLLLAQISEETCSVFTYHLTTGTVAQTFRDEKLLENYDRNLSPDGGMMLFGGRYGLSVDQDESLWVYDLKTGNKYPVNGFTMEQGGRFLSNTSNTKLLYSVANDTVDDSLGISQLGVLDLETGIFTAFDRKGYENLHEWSAGWFDDNRVEIRSGESDANAIYLYEF